MIEDDMVHSFRAYRASSESSATGYQLGGGRPRAWQRMLSGRRLDLLDPSPSDIAIEDIAHGLARVARWNGQTTGEHALSVAQHALLVDGICEALHPDWPRVWRLAALLHDAPEYVIGDLISPFKAAIGLDYRAFEQRLQSAVHARFGLPHPLPDAVKQAIKSADRVAAYFEATRLAGFSNAEAERYFGPRVSIVGPVVGTLETLSARPAAQMQSAFLARFYSLSPVSDRIASALPPAAPGNSGEQRPDGGETQGGPA